LLNSYMKTDFSHASTVSVTVVWSGVLRGGTARFSLSGTTYTSS
jgi:hypothetical protein